MWSRSVREFVGRRLRGRSPVTTAFVATLVAALATIPGVAQEAPALAVPPAGAPVDPGCASDRLPSEILDGPAQPPGVPLQTVDVKAPRARLRLAVASDERERDYGLMCVLRLRAQHGMIFVFPQDDAWEFWMKNTLVPLDIVWLSPKGDVSAVSSDVPAVRLDTPDGALPRRRGRGLYVIELAANEATADGIVVGSHLAVPELHADR